MTRVPFLLVSVLAGCLSEGPAAGPPVADPGLPPQDSEPRHEIHDLATGIDRTWWFHVASPGGPDAVVRFALEGPVGTPRSTGSVCLAYELDLVHGDGARRASTGRRGNCGEALAVSIEAGSGGVLYELRGADVLPGTYRFDASGGPQAGSLVVDLAAR